MENQAKSTSLVDATESLRNAEGRLRIWKTYEKYRDSGVEVLGALPSHWETKPLKRIADINTEELSARTDPDYTIKYVDITNVDSVRGIMSVENHRFEDAPSRARRVVCDGDTIISTVRTYLRAIAWVVNPPGNMIVSTGFAVLRPDKEVDAEYLYRIVQAEEFIGQVVAYSAGVSYPAIAPTRLGRFRVQVPPIDEQRGIAAFLRRETSKIDSLVTGLPTNVPGDGLMARQS